MTGAFPEVTAAWTRVLLLLRRLGQRPVSAVIFIGLLGLAGSTLFGLARGIPLPGPHDEFSYLLAAETFAEGRLTNPTHPHWEHFETFHVIHQPTYQSKYPPGQGLLLAVGQALTGHPVAGVWLGAGLLAAVMTWALLIWLPPSWAVLAGLFCTAQVSWFSYWSQGYLGGTVAAVGGALCLGSYRALTTRPRLLHGVFLGLGLGILAASRPFEGAIVGGFVVVALIVRLFRSDKEHVGRLVRQGLGPAGGVCAVMLVGLGAYNHQVTGSALTMPYQVHDEQYSGAPNFLFQTPGVAPEYRHAAMERFWVDWARERHRFHRSWEGLVQRRMERAGNLFWFFLGGGVAALLGLLDRQGLRREKFALGGLVLILAASLSTPPAYSHYAAPATLLFFVVMGRGFQRLHRRARRKRSLNLGPAIVVVSTFLLALGAVRFLDSDRSTFMVKHTVSAMIQEVPGNHLVLVTYGEDHNVLEEWVYNSADIDGSRIVWARSMGPDRDEELRGYFADRTHWTFRAGRGEIQLAPIRSEEEEEGGR